MAELKSVKDDYIIMDHLIHDKMSSGEEVILLPITRYDNILGAPRVVTSLDDFVPAPFFMYAQDEVELDSFTLVDMFGSSFENV